MAPKWRILLWLSHHTITNNDTWGCISDRYTGHERRMESIRTTTNDVERTTQKRWSYLHTVGEGTRQTYTTILCTTRILISTNHNIRTTQVSKKVHKATDGGAVPLKGSMGFIIMDEEGTVLLTCFGQPSGKDTLLFWSEICAILAAIRLITLLTKYYNKKLQREDKITRGKIQVYTDSLSMVKKSKLYDKYPTAPLTTVLDSEWDNVLLALHLALNHFIQYPKISWVKSHQDDKE